MTHELPATPETTRVGVIDQAHAPVLTVDSGDVVVFETWQHWGDAVTRDTTIEDVIRLRTEKFPGVGPHTLTGPVEVRGALPGQALRVDVMELVPRDHGFNLNLPSEFGTGLLPEDFPHGGIRHFDLDVAAMVTDFAPGIRVPLAPFLGIMGVAPPVPGVHSSIPPGPFGGNMDISSLVAGTTLFLPVFVPGARFYVGDAHACQGDGEVNLTAIETAMDTARLRLSVEADLRLERPRVETPDAFMTLAFDADLDAAAKTAIRDMIAWLGELVGIAADEAYALCSIAVDLSITQVVNQRRGVHARLDKALFA